MPAPHHDLDPAALYTSERRRFASWLAGRPAEDLDRRVAATPAWRVRDVVAHLVGIPADLNAGRFGVDGRGGDAWTAAQVDERRGRSLDALNEEWEREGPRFEEGLRLFGHEFGIHYVHDLVQHVADVSAALGVDPRRRDEPAIAAFDFALLALDEALRGIEGPAVEVVVTDGERWTVGGHRPVATVRGPQWELLRAIGGRRTLQEVRAMDWEGERDAVAPLLSRYAMPLHPLDEPRPVA